MVNYSYPELFYEHESVHWVIVNSSATVTGVSGSAPTITDADFVLTEEDLALEEMTIEESVCSLDNLSFGQCESSRVQFTMYTKQGLSSLEDVEIAIYLYFNEDSDTLFQVGVYIVDEDALSVDRSTREVVAYDVLYYLQDYDITSWYNNVYASATTQTVKYLRDSLFNWLVTGVSDFNITQETTTLVNDDFAIEKSIESDTITFSFFMQHLLELNGVFGHIDRQGVFVYVSLDVYGTPSDATIDDNLIIPPVQYQDWNTRGIGYVIVYDRNNNKLAKIGTSSYRRPSNYTIVDSFVFYNNSNRANWQEDFEDAVTNLRAAITDRRYRSCEINCIGSLCLEAGDHITLQWNEYDDDDNITVKTFKTYILERRFTGLQGFEDTYTANGDKRQPDYQVHNDNWHTGDNKINSYTGATQLATNASSYDFVELIRNIGFRLLDEPSNVSVEYDEPAPTPPVKTTWVETSWNKGFNGEFVWHDGDTVYYSRYGAYNQQYVLNKSTHTWEDKTWYGLQPGYGNKIWTDGENVYYSNGNGGNYVLNRATDTWVEKTWNGYRYIDGAYVWTDGDIIYYSNYSNQYVLDKATDTWVAKTWTARNTDFTGYDIWKDGNNIYRTNSATFRLNRATSAWVDEGSLWMHGRGSSVWSDGATIYYSSQIGAEYYQYVLNRDTNSWDGKTWEGYTRITGNDIWTDGTNIYFSNVSTHYVLA